MEFENEKEYEKWKRKNTEKIEIGLRNIMQDKKLVRVWKDEFGKFNLRFSNGQICKYGGPIAEKILPEKWERSPGKFDLFL